LPSRAYSRAAVEVCASWTARICGKRSRRTSRS
jgi:hypothetical protein